MKKKSKNNPKPSKAGRKAALAVAYCSALLRELKAAGRACKPNVISVSHLLPRAYCVAKPGGHCAVFAVPPEDREPQMRELSGHGWVMVQNESAADVSLGDWRSLAYVSTGTCGELRVLPNSELSRAGGVGSSGSSALKF